MELGQRASATCRSICYREITHFFQVYKDLEEKKTQVGGWKKAEVARQVIEDARDRWEATKNRWPAPRRRRAALRTDAGRRVALRTGAEGRGAARSGNGTGSRAADTVTHQADAPAAMRSRPRALGRAAPRRGGGRRTAMGAAPRAIKPYSMLSTNAMPAGLDDVGGHADRAPRRRRRRWMSTRTLAPVPPSSSSTRTL